MNRTSVGEAVTDILKIKPSQSHRENAKAKRRAGK
jgi:hypothetical protein